MLKPTPETSRQNLQQEILTSIRDDSSSPTQNPLHGVVSETLSYFPEQAQKFIETMNYASGIEGKKGLWQTIIHPDNRIEYLGTGKTYSAGEIVQTAEAMLRFKKVPPYADQEFYAERSNIERLLEAQRKSPDERKWYEATVAKVCEVMNITENDIVLLENYLEGHAKSNELQAQAWELELQAKALRESAQRAQQEPVQEIESRYPRQAAQ